MLPLMRYLVTLSTGALMLSERAPLLLRPLFATPLMCCLLPLLTVSPDPFCHGDQEIFWKTKTRITLNKTWMLILRLILLHLSQRHYTMIYKRRVLVIQTLRCFLALRTRPLLGAMSLLTILPYRLYRPFIRVILWNIRMVCGMVVPVCRRTMVRVWANLREAVA